MSSPTYVTNAVADNATDPMLLLLTIDHVDLPSPIRLVRNKADIVSRGNTFTAFPFDFVAPGATDGGSRPARITIDNVNQVIVQTVRALTSPPTLLVEVVLASALNTVEDSLPVFKLFAASGDRYALEAEINDSAEDEAEPLMQWTCTPSQFPALHG